MFKDDLKWYVKKLCDKSLMYFWSQYGWTLENKTVRPEMINISDFVQKYRTDRLSRPSAEWFQDFGDKVWAEPSNQAIIQQSQYAMNSCSYTTPTSAS